MKSKIDQAPTIAFQGQPGAYSDLACRHVFPTMSTLPCDAFEDAFAAVREGRAELAMMPIENSVAGRVADIHHLMPDSGLYIIGEHFERVNHHLLGLPGAKLDAIRTVRSHVHALGQCRNFIRAHGLTPVVAADTAGSAAEIKERGDKTIGAAHLAALALLMTKLLPAWGFVFIMVVTRTSLAGAGHYHLHRKWKDQRRYTMPIGKALFDINYVGTSLIGSDGHVLLHHPYLGSGADVKKTFFDSMLRLHPILRIPGYTLHKLGISLTGLPFRAVEIARFERPMRNGSGTPDAIRTDFWLIRAWIVAEFVACLVTGHIVAWLVQFVITLWFNTFLVVASHDFEESTTEEELAAIPEPLRNDWAAQQIGLSYDLTVVGNRWIDLFLSAGLSPHRVHHVLPWQGSGFANIASEQTVKEVCAQVGIAWQRPRNLLFERFPAVMKHYLLCPAKPAPAPPPPAVDPGLPPPPPGPHPVQSKPTVRQQVGTLVRYAFDGWRGVGV